MNKKINLDSQIRIVDNEGPITKKTIKALETIDKIIGRYNASMINVSNLIQEYNKKYNDKLSELKIHGGKLEKYNDNLSESSLKSLCHYHIAKWLYFVFDLKPLEDKVFVPAEKSHSTTSVRVQVFPSAEGSRSAEYCIKNGTTYRDDQINSAKGYNKDVVFRSKIPEKDSLSLLVQKTLDHVYTSIMSFLSFTDGFASNESYPKSILEAFAQLIEYDYHKLPPGSFVKKVNNICENIKIFQDDTDTSLTTSGEVETGVLSAHDFSFF
ncbi:MAG: hypothetical protein LBE72_05920 [Rickettsia sp.]|nr:hypothetical protein [Rickettsia sp.]